MTKRIIDDPFYGNRLKTIRCEFSFGDKFIRCDSKVEFACLDYIVKTFVVTSIERCRFIIPFQFEGVTRNYVPDFKVELSDGRTMIVEAKCEFISEHLRTKWRYYYETIPFKREALKKFCSEQGFGELYFDRSMHRKFYNTCKPQIAG